MKKNKTPLLFLFLFPLLFSFASPAFDEAMGLGTPSWKFVQTKEDIAQLNGFKRLYEKNSTLFENSTGIDHIPKVIHFIWLGPAPFPSVSIENVKQWMQKHPEWKVQLWSDIETNLPCSGIVLRRFEDFPLHELKSLYLESDNMGEKSEILRYAILLNEGGLYVDHDTTPLRSLDPLQNSYSFYCGLENLAPSILSSSVFPATHLIASKSHHPVIEQAIDWLMSEWDALEQAYPISDQASLINRVKHRSFSALSEGIKRGIDKEGNRDIVFPSSCFSLSKRSATTWSTHAHLGTWHKKENVWETKILAQLNAMEKQENRTNLLVYALLVLNAALCVWLLVKKKRSMLFMLLLPTCLFSSDDFDVLMGRNTSHWNHLTQSIDKQEFDVYKALYERNKKLLSAPPSAQKIPRVIHFIWLGPKPFPPESVENVRTWMAVHPDWIVKFWTDRNRPPPCSQMHVCDVRDFSFSYLKKCYDSSDNYGEQSDLLRFEILHKEGGVYVDHDANCLHSFEELHAGFDFYCCLETPHPPFVGRNLTAGNGVLGARPGHPTVAKVIELISNRWERLGHTYAGKDFYSRTQRVMARTYIALTDALTSSVDQGENVDIVLPAGYFFAKTGIASIYSKHFYATAWADSGADSGNEKNGFAKNLHKEIGKFKQHRKRTEKAIWGLVALSLLLVIFVCKKSRTQNT